MKKLAWLLVIFSSLMLPTVYNSLYASFENKQMVWETSFVWWNNLTPFNTMYLVTSSAVLVGAMTIVAKMKTKIGFTLVAGTLLSALMLKVITEINTMFSENFELSYLLDFYKADLIGLIITGFLTTLVGIWFAKPIVSPENENPVIKAIARTILSLAEKIFGKERVRERTRFWWRMQA